MLVFNSAEHKFEELKKYGFREKRYKEQTSNGRDKQINEYYWEYRWEMEIGGFELKVIEKRINSDDDCVVSFLDILDDYYDRDYIDYNYIALFDFVYDLVKDGLFVDGLFVKEIGIKSIEEILDNYKEDYQIFVKGYADAFGASFRDFLTIEQMERIGYKYADEKDKEKHKPKEWCYKNILEQLKKDAEFGLKAKNENANETTIEVMNSVCHNWYRIIGKSYLYYIKGFEKILEFVDKELEQIKGE